MGIPGTVLGASGYSGGELVRLLCAHPAFELVALGAERAAGRPLATVQPHVAAHDLPPLVTTAQALEREAEIVFSCLPADAPATAELGDRRGVVIDLSDAHRSADGWIYGLTEFARDDLTDRVANPGCYPTAALLALVPFARAGAIGSPISIAAMSGLSGAGRSNDDTYSLASAYGDAAAYGTARHRHVPEMERYLKAFSGFDATVSFTPHLIPMSRGLLATIRAPLVATLDDASALQVLHDAYDKEPFVEVAEEWPRTKSVAGSNLATVSARVDERAGLLICSAAIDNLGKGAAGQALQNANVIFGLEETLGLARSGVWP